MTTNQIDLNIIVNGKPFTVEANINEPLKAEIPKALVAAGQQGRQNEDWQLKLNGNALPLDAKIKDLGLTSGITLFLTLEAGDLG
jgi:hypothetical protein